MPVRLPPCKACLFAALLSPLTPNVSHPAELQLCSRHHARLLLAYYSSPPHCKAGEGTCGLHVTSWQHRCTVPGGNAPGQVGVPRTEPRCLSSDPHSPYPRSPPSHGARGPLRSHVCSLVMLECNEVRPPDDQEVVFRDGWWKGRRRLWGWEAAEREHREAKGQSPGCSGAWTPGRGMVAPKLSCAGTGDVVLMGTEAGRTQRSGAKGMSLEWFLRN